MLPRMSFLSRVEQRLSLDTGVGSGVVNNSHACGFLRSIFAMLDDGREGKYGIMGLSVGFCSQLAICERVEEFSMCCQSGNEETFKEFSEGVMEVYASVGCWVCLLFSVSFVDRL